MPFAMSDRSFPSRSYVLPASLAVALFGAIHAFAQTNAPATQPISLAECIERAVSHNLDVAIERINPAISFLDLDAARAGYDPNFTATQLHSYTVSGGGLDANKLPIPGSRSDTDSFSSGFSGNGPMGMTYNLSGRVNESYGTRPGPFDTSSGSIGLSVTQPLLRNFFYDATRYNIAVAKNRLKVSDLRLQAQIINVVSLVEQAYYELIAAKESVRVQENGFLLAEKLVAQNRKRVEIGTMTRLDEKQSESQMAARKTDLIIAQQALASAQNTLKNLITDNYRTLHDAPLEPTETLPNSPVILSLQDSWNKGLTLRPDVLQSRLDLERQGIVVKYLKNQKLPQLDLGGSYGFGASGNTVREFNDAFDDFRRGDKPFWTIGATFSVPLGNRVPKDRYRQGKLTADQLLLQLKKLEESVLVQIDESVNQIRSSSDRVESARQARVYAEQALDAEQKKLDAGTSTSFVVLQLQRDAITASQQEIRALADYNKALAQLYQNEGTTLQRRKINLQIK